MVYWLKRSATKLCQTLSLYLQWIETSCDSVAACFQPYYPNGFYPAFRLFIALLLSSTTFVSAECSSFGEFGKWPEGFVDTACHSLSGHYIGGEQKRDCSIYDYDPAAGTKGFWNFLITMNGGGGDLDFEECKKRLGDEAIGCKQGGVSDIGDWTFRYVS